MPTVSVLLPVYNAADTIGRAVDSILKQTISDLELIIVDDGSTDDLASALAPVNDLRIHLSHATHRGVAAAANAAFEQAQGEYIARMDADDVSHPERLAAQLNLLERVNLDAVGCRVQMLDERRRPVNSMQRYLRWINEETLTEENITALRFVELPLVNPTILAKRSYFELGYREGDFPEDYDLFLRAANQGMRFGKVEQPLFDWTDSPGRLTRSDSRYSPEAFDRCRRQALLAGPLAGVNQIDLWGVGQTGKPWLRWLQEQGFGVRRAYDVAQKKIGQEVRGVGVLSPEAMPPADGTPLLIAVGAAGARELIRPHVEQQGHVVGRDAWFVA